MIREKVHTESAAGQMQTARYKNKIIKKYSVLLIIKAAN